MENKDEICDTETLNCIDQLNKNSPELENFSKNSNIKENKLVISKSINKKHENSPNKAHITTLNHLVNTDVNSTHQDETHKTTSNQENSSENFKPENSVTQDKTHLTLNQVNGDEKSNQDKNDLYSADRLYEHDAVLSDKHEGRDLSESSLLGGNQAVEDTLVRRRKGKSADQTSDALRTRDERVYEDDDSLDAVMRREKIKEIRKVLSSHPIDLERLKELAISKEGLIDDELRREAWPVLMGLKIGETEAKPPMSVVESHKDYQQVDLDVKRTLKRFPPNIENSQRQILMEELNMLIIRVLIKHPDLHYYQGYHDVAITFLLVTGEDVGFQLVEKLSITHLRDFMQPTMEKTNEYLTYLYPILENTNPSLYKCLDQSGVGTVFCLPWLITWFAHTLSDYRNVVRLYDFFLASPDLMPMYIATAIVLLKEHELLSDKEKDISSIFVILSKDPDNLPFEDILVKARQLYQSYPPHTLTTRVKDIIAKREQREKEERELINKKRSKADSSEKRGGSSSVVGRILTYIPFPRVIPVRQRTNIIKLVLFAASIVIARRLYKYYYESAIDYNLPEL